MVLATQTTKGTYQEYPLLGVNFRRTEGLTPDTGSVILDYSLLDDILIEYEGIPWRPAHRSNIAVPISIIEWFTRVGTTISEGDFFKEPVKPTPRKLGLFGDLVLTTTEDGSDKEPVQYNDIYVDGGLEEIIKGIVDIRDHDKGPIKIPVTDIRRFYATHGAVNARLNVKLENGDYDEYTVREGSGGKLIPFQATEILRYLFRHLPGSPEILGDSELFKLKLKAPENIIIRPARGELVSWIQRLLDKYRLIAKLTRANNYIVERRGSTFLEKDHIATPKFKGRKIEPETDHLNVDEIKTTTFTNRPWALQVFGEPPIRRRTLQFVPIFQDPTTKHYFWLEDIFSVWDGDYTFIQVLEQINVGHEKAFKDVKPGIDENPELHRARREALKTWAFKGYAPLSLILDTKLKTKKGIGYLTDTSGAAVFFLPMTDVGIYQEELEEIISRIPQDDGISDKEDLEIRAPVVIGRGVGQDRFTNFDKVQEHFNGIRTALKNDQARANGFAISLNKELGEVEKDYLRSQKSLNDFKASSPGFLSRLGATVLVGLNELGIKVASGRDYQERFTGFTTDDFEKGAILNQEAMEANRASIRDHKKLVERQIKQAAQDESRANAALGVHDEHFRNMKKVYEKLEGLFFWMNLPTHIIPEGKYNLDLETGILKFSDPMYGMSQPFVEDRDSATAAIDGGIYVTFGYELKGNTTQDVTNVIFIPDPDEEDGVLVAGVNRSTLSTAAVEYVQGMRMYQTDEGTPMNFAAVIEQASDAADELKGPTTVEGFVYPFSGIIPIELAGGTNMVTYTWLNAETKEDSTPATTTVHINAPRGKGPMGPPARNPKISNTIPLEMVRLRLSGE